jgi:hypothetical protein
MPDSVDQSTAWITLHCIKRGKARRRREQALAARVSVTRYDPKRRPASSSGHDRGGRPASGRWLGVSPWVVVESEPATRPAHTSPSSPMSRPTSDTVRSRSLRLVRRHAHQKARASTERLGLRSRRGRSGDPAARADATGAAVEISARGGARVRPGRSGARLGGDHAAGSRCRASVPAPGERPTSAPASRVSSGRTRAPPRRLARQRGRRRQGAGGRARGTTRPLGMIVADRPVRGSRARLGVAGSAEVDAEGAGRTRSRAGADVAGTDTDLALFDPATGAFRIATVPSDATNRADGAPAGGTARASRSRRSSRPPTVRRWPPTPSAAAPNRPRAMGANGSGARATAGLRHASTGRSSAPVVEPRLDERQHARRGRGVARG